MKSTALSVVNYKPVEGQKFTLPSETIPDQSMTVQDILKNYSRGIPIGAAERQPIYDDLDDYRGMDLVELQELQEDVQREIDDYHAQIDMINKAFAEKQKIKENDRETDQKNNED